MTNIYVLHYVITNFEITDQFEGIVMAKHNIQHKILIESIAHSYRQY